MRYTFTHRDHMLPWRVEEIYQLIMREPSLARTLWYDGQPLDLEAFKNKVKEWWLVRVASADDHTVGVFWLNGYQGRTAQLHFAIFEWHRHEAVWIGEEAMQWLKDLGWLHSVYGMTPATHRHVLPFVEALGFQIIGRIPGACWVQRKQKFVDGVVSVYDFRRNQ